MGSVVWVGTTIMHRISGHSLLRHWHGRYDMCMGEANLVLLSSWGQLIEGIGIVWGEEYCEFIHNILEGLKYLVYYIIVSSYV